MRALWIAALSVFACGALAAEPQIGTHRFEDYRVNVYHGRIAKPDFVRYPDFRGYRTRLRAGAKQGVQFAGHYAIVVIGCGTGCANFYLVDVKTGAIIMLPIGGEDHRTVAELTAKPSSRLLKSRQEDYAPDYTPICREKEYSFDGKKLNLLWEKSKPGDCPW